MKTHYKLQKSGACHGKSESRFIYKVDCPNCLRNIIWRRIIGDMSKKTADKAVRQLKKVNPKAYDNYFPKKVK